MSATRRILVTRHPEQAGELESGLREAGLDVGFFPVTEQRLPADRTEIAAAIAELERGDFDWLVITSGNTVRFLKRAGWSGSSAGARVGVVGAGTARVLHELTGIADPWMPRREASAAGILRELRAPKPGERVLLPQSAQARPLLREGLSERGWRVTAVTAYDTVPLAAPEGYLEADDVVLITSSSAAEAWVARALRPAMVLAIGEPTAGTLKRLGHPACAVLETPTAAGVLATLGHDEDVDEGDDEDVDS